MHTIINPVEIAQNVVAKEIVALQALHEVFGREFEKLVEVLVQNKNKILISGIGKSGHIGRKIASTLSSIGFPAVFLHPAEAGHGDLGLIAKNDIMILLSNSGETSELKSIINYCKQYNNKIIGITRQPRSTLYQYSDIKILLPNIPEVSDLDIPTTSTTMMLVFGDALAIAMKNMVHFTKTDYKKYHPYGKIGMRLMSVAELMHSGERLPLVNRNEKISNVILEMTSKCLGCAIVTDKNTKDKDAKMIGIITDGDLRRHININFGKYIAADIMSSRPVTINDNLLASEALTIMQEKSITQLVIVDKNTNHPIGVIHIHDLLKIGL